MKHEVGELGQYEVKHFRLIQEAVSLKLRVERLVDGDQIISASFKRRSH